MSVFYPIKPTALSPTLDEDYLKTVGRIMQENSDGAIELFADLIAEATGKKSSKSTVHRIIVGQGLSFKKKSKLASERERADFKKTENYLHALEEGFENGSIDPDDLVFIEKSGSKSDVLRMYIWWRQL
ncbi:MAG: hypothetical protein P8176_05450 [Gammaproteobacteria bacterium]